MSLSMESPFHHKVVYIVDASCWIWQKSIHHERENTMLFSSISVINGRLFLHCSIVWRQICWTDYRTIFEELTSENKCIFALRKHWCVLNCTKNLLVSSTPSPIKCLITKLRTNWNIHLVWCCMLNFYWEMDRNEKHWIKNARGRSNLCLSRIFILLEN